MPCLFVRCEHELPRCSAQLKQSRTLSTSSFTKNRNEYAMNMQKVLTHHLHLRSVHCAVCSQFVHIFSRDPLICSLARFQRFPIQLRTTSSPLTPDMQADPCSPYLTAIPSHHHSSAGTDNKPRSSNGYRGSSTCFPQESKETETSSSHKPHLAQTRQIHQGAQCHRKGSSTHFLCQRKQGDITSCGHERNL